MGSCRGFLTLAVLMVFAMPIKSETTYVYFSDFDQCGKTYKVGRDNDVEIAGKRFSTSSSSAFTDCPLLFRAGALEDKLCVRISTLTFSNDKLQLQYFASLDPNVGAPNKTYDSTTPNDTPIEICSNEYEISFKLHNKDGNARIENIDVLITVFNMQGTRRIVYFDEDCGNTIKLRDSTISVQTINAAKSNGKVDLCQLTFEYIGTNPNKTVCIEYLMLKADVCDYSLKVLDGSQTGGFTVAHTYTCTQTEPQRWCSTKKTIQLELTNSGSTALLDNTFSIQVKDATSANDFDDKTVDPEVFPVWAIVVIVVAVVAVIIIIIAAVVIKKINVVKEV